MRGCLLKGLNDFGISLHIGHQRNVFFFHREANLKALLNLFSCCESIKASDRKKRDRDTEPDSHREFIEGPKPVRG